MPARTDLNKPAAMLGQPEAPKAFNAAERALWRDIVSSRPASAWTPSDVVLLTFYVSAASDINRYDDEISRQGEVLGGKVNPFVKIRAMREVFFLSLGMKLKLMPSNRYDGKTVSRLGQHAKRASAAMTTLDADDLLGGVPTKRRNLQ